MFVFVDESGDAGVRGKPGSSRYFIVTAIILDDQDELSQMGRTVDDVRESLGFPKTAEFKFNKSSGGCDVRSWRRLAHAISSTHPSS